ncbi:MAG: serpin family protein [Candidatus Marinimicrobia bacterium]|nr:serpin family protein [Candidatus Neomarinimicrobiota bacterium]
MLRRRYQLTVFITLLSLNACMEPENNGPDYSVLSRDLTPDELALTQATDRFGLKLFREIVAQDASGGNIFISPLSVSMALGMTANGAADSTLAAMRSTLELDGLTEEESNQAYQSLIELLLEADPKVQFALANSIWTNEGWTFTADFLQRTKDYFDAEVRSEDFTDPATVDLINNWIEGKTNGKITDMLDAIPVDAVMYLINAIYFKGTWLYEFDAANTVDDDFTLADGSNMPIRMMKQEADLLYGRDDNFQMVDLPYGDGLFRMTVLLPRDGVHVDSVAGMLTPEAWSGWIDQLDTTGIVLELPRFKFQYKLKMNDVLKSLGMAVAFDERNADFTRMFAARTLFISRVLHQSFVQVDEKGTEAAAATIVEISRISASSDPTYRSFRVDRPFIFVIREKTSGTMLFIGKVMEPVWEE